MSDFKFDLREFQQGMKDIASEGKTDEVAILNKAVLIAIIGGGGVAGAMKTTPKANLAGLDRKLVAGGVAEKLRRQGRYRGLSSAEFDRLVTEEMVRRKRSVGYTAGPGWDKAARAFGGTGVFRQSGFDRSEAAKGFGDVADERHMVAEISNSTPWAIHIGREPLQQAFDAVGQDMQRHHAEKLQKTFDRHAGK